MISRRVLPLVVGLLSLAVVRAEAQTWIDWSAVTPGASGSAAGSLPLTTGPVGVRYSGEVGGGSATSTGTSLGSYFDPYTYPGTYTSTTAPVGPTNNGWIQLVGPSKGNVLSFSSPIDRLFFAIMSLGQGGSATSYTFSQPFSILSQGPASYGGCNGCLTQPASNTVTGVEGDGVLMFNGPISTLTFDVVGQEYFHGFTIGVEAITTPEPASLALLATGLVGVFGAVRMRRKSRRDV